MDEEIKESIKNDIKSDFSKIDFTQKNLISKVIVYVWFTFFSLFVVLFVCLKDIILFRWLNIPYSLQLLFISEEAIKEVLFKK